MSNWCPTCKNVYSSDFQVCTRCEDRNYATESGNNTWTLSELLGIPLFVAMVVPLISLLWVSWYLLSSQLPVIRRSLEWAPFVSDWVARSKNGDGRPLYVVLVAVAVVLSVWLVLGLLKVFLRVAQERSEIPSKGVGLLIGELLVSVALVSAMFLGILFPLVAWGVAMGRDLDVGAPQRPGVWALSLAGVGLAALSLVVLAWGHSD